MSEEKRSVSTAATDVIEGLTEVLDWVKGNGKMRVTFPGERSRDMTWDEYLAVKEPMDEREIVGSSHA